MKIGHKYYRKKIRESQKICEKICHYVRLFEILEKKIVL
jgi:hypothetical protein